jgi:hypothetical protein
VNYVEIGCRAALGVVFLTSAATKLSGRASFAEFVASLRRMDVVPRRLAGPIGGLVVTGEVAVVVFLALPFTASAATGFGLAALLLCGFTGAIVVSLRRGRQTTCRCFGASTVPLGRRHVARNAVLVAAAGLGLAGTVMGGSAQPLALFLAVVAGLTAGGLLTVLDDVVALFRPTTMSSR